MAFTVSENIDLYGIFGDQDLLVTGLNDGRACFYAKVDERIIDRFLTLWLPQGDSDYNLSLPHGWFKAITHALQASPRAIAIRHIPRRDLHPLPLPYRRLCFTLVISQTK